MSLGLFTFPCMARAFSSWMAFHWLVSVSVAVSAVAAPTAVAIALRIPHRHLRCTLFVSFRLFHSGWLRNAERRRRHHMAPPIRCNSRQSSGLWSHHSHHPHWLAWTWTCHSHQSAAPSCDTVRRQRPQSRRDTAGPGKEQLHQKVCVFQWATEILTLEARCDTARSGRSLCRRCPCRQREAIPIDWARGPVPASWNEPSSQHDEQISSAPSSVPASWLPN